MLKILRIVGMVVFAFLASFAIHSLIQMYEFGHLMDPYNSQRKAEITLLSFSLFSLLSLGVFEWKNIQWHRQFRASRVRHRRSKELVEDLGAFSIYDAPKTEKVWGGNCIRPVKVRNDLYPDKGTRWMLFLRVLCVVVPMLYSVLIAMQLMQPHGNVPFGLLLPLALGSLLVFSIITVCGIWLKQMWGMKLGYVWAICNLLIFPYGIAVGLFLLIGLAGASPIFAVSASARRKHTRKMRRMIAS